jgi:hypothetical protein
MPKRSLQVTIAALLVVLASVAPAGSCSMLLCGAGGGSGGATNFLLSNTGSALLVNTGVKFLVQ